MKSRHEVDFSLEWLHGFSKVKKFERIFSEWIGSGYKKEGKPSLDRINHNKPYTKSNVQWLTWAENRFKQTMERRSRKGPVLQFKDGEIIARYTSQREAVRKTGLNQSLLSAVLNGKREHTGGYVFAYESPELLTQLK